MINTRRLIHEKTIMILLVGAFAMSVFSAPHKPKQSHRPAPRPPRHHVPDHPSKHHTPKHHNHKSSGAPVAAGIIGGAIVGAAVVESLRPDPVVVTPAPVVVPQPVVVHQPVVAVQPVTQVQNVWVEAAMYTGAMRTVGWCAFGSLGIMSNELLR